MRRAERCGEADVVGSGSGTRGGSQRSGRRIGGRRVLQSRRPSRGLSVGASHSSKSLVEKSGENFRSVPVRFPAPRRRSGPTGGGPNPGEPYTPGRAEGGSGADRAHPLPSPRRIRLTAGTPRPPQRHDPAGHRGTQLATGRRPRTRRRAPIPMSHWFPWTHCFPLLTAGGGGAAAAAGL